MARIAVAGGLLIVSAAAPRTVLAWHAPTTAATGWSPEAVALCTAGPALLDAWRLYDTDAPRWVRWAARAWQGFGVGWAWSF